MKPFKSLMKSKKKEDICAHCGCEIKAPQYKVSLKGKVDILNIVNRQRSERGATQITESDIICSKCSDSACMELCKTVPAVVKVDKLTNPQETEPMYENLEEMSNETSSINKLSSCANCCESLETNGGRVFLQENCIGLAQINKLRSETATPKLPLRSECFVCYKCFLSATKVNEEPRDNKTPNVDDDSRPTEQMPSTSKSKKPIEHPSCAQCGHRLSRTPGRPRSLDINSGILKYINKLRREMNDPIITQQCTLCFPCYKRAYDGHLELEEADQQTDDDVEMQDASCDVGEMSQQFSECVSVSESSRSWSGPSQSQSQSLTESERMDDIQEDDTPIVTLEIDSIPVSHAWCCVCQKLNWRCNVPTEARVKLWLESGVFIPYENRVCKDHIDKDSKFFKASAVASIQNIEFLRTATFTTKSLARWISELSSKCESIPNRGRLSFRCLDYFALDDFDCFFGISRTSFLLLHKECIDYLRDTKARSTFDALAMFLIKLRQNPSLRTLACMFGVSRQAVGKCIIKIRGILFKQFVKKHLGYHHISRETYIKEWHTHMATKLTGAKEGQAIVIIDGTYLKIQKSRNYKVQRKTWSLHKHANLVKPMMIVAPNGKILAVEGPYLANAANNDANIFKSMQKDKQGFRSFFKPGDFIIEDRGFRDSNKLMAKLGFTTEMPHFIGNRRQHPTNEANESRLVTKIRFVVESANGRIKNKFKFFRDVIPNKYLDNSNALQEYFMIACAMLNAFCPPLKQDTPEDLEFADAMLERSEMPNLMHDKIKLDRYERRTKDWKEIGTIKSDCLPDFPKLTMRDLRRLTFGVYQIKEAPSYIGQALDEDGDISIYLHDNLGPAGLRFEVRSRHQGHTIYKLWIGYKPNTNNWHGIAGWYCECRSGARIVGMCAHIASIIWYLSYSRYHTRVLIPGQNVACTVRDANTFSYDDEYAIESDSDSEVDDESEEQTSEDSEPE